MKKSASIFLALCMLFLILFIGAHMFRNYRNSVDYLVDTKYPTAKAVSIKQIKKDNYPNLISLLNGQNTQKIYHGNRQIKKIALTFDDGPHHKFTPRILKILARYKVPATFFVVGKKARIAPELIQALDKQGIEIANHTYYHPNLTKASVPRIAQELMMNRELIRKITGKNMYLFRPPGGERDRRVIVTAAKLGFFTVLWSVNPGDYESPSREKIKNTILEETDNGGIVLLHDGIEQTISVLPSVISQLQKRGYKFVTVSELLNGLPEKNRGLKEHTEDIMYFLRDLYRNIQNPFD